ncbi:uncharacterized protein LOC123863134 [Mirounga angustirostris]|uniref:uncharacterized protein LOC123863134 n=1 Tax=Mirounga angustirostris TaxID=9716 RepID=UPI001E68F110|nr:uncharacterized protein LOC123863134 [Mirounga angustirostris]
MGIFGTATIGAPSRVPSTASGLWTWQRALAVGREPSVVGGGGALTRTRRLHLLLGGDAHPPGIPWRLVNDAGESSCQAAGGVEPRVSGGRASSAAVARMQCFSPAPGDACHAVRKPHCEYGIGGGREASQVRPESRQVQSTPETWLQPDGAAQRGQVDGLRDLRTRRAPTPDARSSALAPLPEVGRGRPLGCCSWQSLGLRNHLTETSIAGFTAKNKSGVAPSKVSSSLPRPGHKDQRGWSCADLVTWPGPGTVDLMDAGVMEHVGPARREAVSQSLREERPCDGSRRLPPPGRGAGGHDGEAGSHTGKA